MSATAVAAPTEIPKTLNTETQENEGAVSRYLQINTWQEYLVLTAIALAALKLTSAAMKGNMGKASTHVYTGGALAAGLFEIKTSRLKGSLAASASKLEAEVYDLAGTNDKLANNVTDLTDQLGVLTDQLGILQGVTDVLRDQNTAAYDRIVETLRAHKEEVESRRATLLQLQSQINTNKKDLDKARADLEEARADNKATKEELIEKKEEVQQAEKDLKTTLDNIRRATRQMSNVLLDNKAGINGWLNSHFPTLEGELRKTVLAALVKHKKSRTA